MRRARFCPYCHAAIPPEASPVCMSAGCLMRGRSVQTKPERLLARAPEMLRIQAGRLLAGREHLCERCGRQGRYVCSACGRELPAQWGRYPEVTVTLIGAEGAGKSTLLACMLQDLAASGRAQLRALDIETTAERLHAEYTRPLFEENAAVQKTPSGLPKPLIYACSAQTNALLPPQGALVMLYDPPGSYFGKHAAMKELTPLLSRTDAFLLCVDMTRVRAGEEWPRAERLLDAMRLPQELGGRCQTPLAIVLTRADAWEREIAPLPEGERERDMLLREYIAESGGAGLLSRLTEYRAARVFAGGLFQDEKSASPLVGARAPLAYALRHCGMVVR